MKIDWFFVEVFNCGSVVILINTVYPPANGKNNLDKVTPALNNMVVENFIDVFG